MGSNLRSWGAGRRSFNGGNFEGEEMQNAAACIFWGDRSKAIMAIKREYFPFLSPSDEQGSWHDCSQFLSPSDEDFSDLEFLQFFRLQGSDKSGNRIFHIVGKYFPAPAVSGERLKKYIYHKICSELPEGPFCIVYMHSTVQKEDNCI